MVNVKTLGIAAAVVLSAANFVRTGGSNATKRIPQNVLCFSTDNIKCSSDKKLVTINGENMDFIPGSLIPLLEKMDGDNKIEILILEKLKIEQKLFEEIFYGIGKFKPYSLKFQNCVIKDFDASQSFELLVSVIKFEVYNTKMNLKDLKKFIDLKASTLKEVQLFDIYPLDSNYNILEILEDFLPSFSKLEKLSLEWNELDFKPSFIVKLINLNINEITLLGMNITENVIGGILLASESNPKFKNDTLRHLSLKESSKREFCGAELKLFKYLTKLSTLSIQFGKIKDEQTEKQIFVDVYEILKLNELNLVLFCYCFLQKEGWKDIFKHITRDMNGNIVEL